MHPLQQPSQHQGAQSARPVPKVRTGGSPVSVSVAASLALMGDSLLYAVLAAEAPALGIPLVSVGLLLSANRFVRLITNSLAGAVYHRYGREWPYFLAMVASAFTTFAYGLPIGFAFFLLARLAWGTCWSFLNLGMYLSVLEHSDERTRGQWMGRIKSISRIGTIVAVTLGAYLTDLVGFRPVVFGMGVLALAGAAVSLGDVRAAVQNGRRRTGNALRAEVPSRSEGRDAAHGGQAADAGPGQPVHAPDPAQQTRPLAQPQTQPGRVYILHFLGFIFGFIMNGVVVGTLALLVLQRYGESVGLFGTVLGAATLSGLLLGVRWVAEIAWGPLAGAVGDRVGAERAVLVSAAAMAAGLAGLAWASGPHLLILLETGVFVAGVTLSVCLDSVVGRVAIGTNRVNKVMSLYVTAQDLGSALGPLVGYLVGVGVGLEGLYVGASLLLVFGALLSVAAHRRVA